mmetsp:Transcript_4509/g.9175  ORF Transcript_4509/g.9175 Transcript_4509/m.9175 type:complete len:153 (+) Transcript_4509:1959-2417(+)
MNKTISATPRQLESLIRLSESIAKMRLSEAVTAEDVELAYDLFLTATKQSMTDPSTGLIDMNMVSGGMSNQDVLLVDQIKTNILEFLTKNKLMAREGISFKEIIDDLSNEYKSTYGTALQMRYIVRAIDNLEEENRLIIGGNSHNKFIKIIE